MLCLFDTGTISLRENVLTWNISNFFSLPLEVGSEIRTAEFPYGDAHYTLAIWPRGLKGVEKEWFGVCLYSRGTSKQRGFIQFSIMTGARVLKSCTIESSESGIYKDDRFMEWSDFSVLRKQIAPNGCLTIVCTLFCEKDYGLEDYELNESIASVKEKHGFERSGDYSFLTSSCMIPRSSLNSAAPGNRKASLAPDAKSRSSSGATNSLFTSSSDAFEVETYAHAEPADSDSLSSCRIAGASALEYYRNSKTELKRSATDPGLSIVDPRDHKPTTPNESNRPSTPESSAECQKNAADSSRARSASNNATASRPYIVSNSREKMASPRPAYANSIAQLPHQSATRGGREVSSADNESSMNSIRISEANSSPFRTPRMLGTRTSTDASEEYRIPAHMLFSPVGNADPVLFGKVYNHKGPLSRNSFEGRPSMENPPLTFLGNSKLLKLNYCTQSSASNGIPSTKQETATTETAKGSVYQLALPDSPPGISTTPNVADTGSMRNPESNISSGPQSVHIAAEEGTATAAEATASGIAADVQLNAIPRSSFPVESLVAEVGLNRREEASFVPGTSHEETKEESGADHVSDPAISSSDNAPNYVAQEAEFRRNLQSLENLSKATRLFYLQREGYDLTIKIQDHEFQAHRGFLKLRSPVFAELLSENESGTLEIPEFVCDPRGFHDFLLYVYDGQVGSVTDANVCAMYKASQFFRFPELRVQCVEFMRNSLSVRIICDVLSVAMQHDEPELLELATVFFAQNLKDILKTDEWKQFLKENFELANDLYVKAIDICYTKTVN